MTVADKSTKFETLPIWGEQIPTGQTEFQPKAEIWRLLGTSQLQQITSAGAAYTSAAEAVTGAVTGIDDYAGKILSIWQGPDADQARVALEAMYATGRQLARALADMGRALETYAGYVPTAIAEVNGITVDKNETAVQEEIGKLGLTLIPNLGARTDAQLLIYAMLEAHAVTRVEDARAQEVLKRLNEKIRSLYISSIPFNINYELPTVTVPSTSGTSTRVVYGDSGGTPGTTSAGRDAAGGAADGGDGTAGVAGTAGQDDDRPSA
ncbi:WXG100 family type VII secretion target, partial [Nonomuraea sp. NPDC004297]